MAPQGGDDVGRDCENDSDNRLNLFCYGVGTSLNTKNSSLQRPKPLSDPGTARLYVRYGPGIN